MYRYDVVEQLQCAIVNIDNAVNTGSKVFLSLALTQIRDALVKLEDDCDQI